MRHQNHILNLLKMRYCNNKKNINLPVHRKLRLALTDDATNEISDVTKYQSAVFFAKFFNLRGRL